MPGDIPFRSNYLAERELEVCAESKNCGRKSVDAATGYGWRMLLFFGFIVCEVWRPHFSEQPGRIIFFDKNTGSQNSRRKGLRNTPKKVALLGSGLPTRYTITITHICADSGRYGIVHYEDCRYNIHGGLIRDSIWIVLIPRIPLLLERVTVPR